MFKTASLSRLFQPCCAAPAAAGDDTGTLHALLAPGSIGLLSARCCDSRMRQADDRLAAQVNAAQARAGTRRPLHLATITAARGQLAALDEHAEPVALRLKDSVATLFQRHGLAAFPVLLVDGEIAFYGGTPELDALVQRLQTGVGA